MELIEKIVEQTVSDVRNFRASQTQRGTRMTHTELRALCRKWEDTSCDKLVQSTFGLLDEVAILEEDAERVEELERENDRLKLAIKDFANLHPIDLLSAREVQEQLLFLCGAKHHHVSTIGSDQCFLCKHDLRHEIHLRQEKEERG